MKVAFFDFDRTLIVTDCDPSVVYSKNLFPFQAQLKDIFAEWTQTGNKLVVVTYNPHKNALTKLLETAYPDLFETVLFGNSSSMKKSVLIHEYLTVQKILHEDAIVFDDNEGILDEIDDRLLKVHVCCTKKVLYELVAYVMCK